MQEVVSNANDIKMISAQYSSNNGKKRPNGMAILWIKERRSYQDLNSQADPARENWTWSYTYFTQNGHFALVENTGIKHYSEVWH